MACFGARPRGTGCEHDRRVPKYILKYMFVYLRDYDTKTMFKDYKIQQ